MRQVAELDHPKRLLFFGLPLDLLSLSETIQIAENAMKSGVQVRHTAMNVAKLIKSEADSTLAEDIRDSDIVGIDGHGIVIGLSLFGVKEAERVAGIDLFYALIEFCAASNRKPFFLGARNDALEAAISEAQRRWPGLEMAGYRDGYFSDEEEADVVDQIANSSADCLFVAMPTPMKERFLKKNAASLRTPFVMGVGGSIDVLAGRVPRAPLWMQRLGMEWLHRLVQEPRKMFWRYAKTNTLFSLKLGRALISRQSPVERP